MARFDLNLLSALNALLSDKNVTRAAERLNVTQPTMSGMLQRLRYQFDDELLVRNGRELELTPYGATLIGPVREALRGIELLVKAEPFFDPAKSTQEFTISSSNYCTSIFLPWVVKHIADTAPGVSLNVQSINNPMERVFSGEVDLCITADDMSLFSAHEEEKIESEILFSDEFVCVVAQDHPLDERSSVEDFFDYQHVSVKMAGVINTIDSVYMDKYLQGRKAAAAVPDFPLVAPMVAQTRLLGLMPSKMAAISARAMPIRAFRPPFVVPRLTEVMMWHARHQQDPAHVWLRGVFRDVAASWSGRVCQQPPLDVMMPRRRATMHPIN